MRKLYVAMVGLPARGKSTLARRLRQGLREEGIEAAIFNNGNVRRERLGEASASAEFFNPDNAAGWQERDRIAMENMRAARNYLADKGEVAILDATNASRKRRATIEETLTDHPVLFIECLNEDPLLLETGLRLKARNADFAGVPEAQALESLRQRISHYEAVYTHVGHESGERYWICLDITANRILGESPCSVSPYYPAIRDILVSTWVGKLYLARHGQTHYNLEGRIGGDPTLTDKGLRQAEALAEHLKDTPISWLFTSTRQRSHQTAAPCIARHPGIQTLALPEFDEIRAGRCESMRYEDIRRDMPDLAAARDRDKYAFVYPEGESYAMLHERVRRGVQRALYLSGDAPIMIIGHQAINRVVLSLFLRRRTEDIPYIYIPQNQYYLISTTARRKLFELVRFM